MPQFQRNLSFRLSASALALAILSTIPTTAHAAQDDETIPAESAGRGFDEHMVIVTARKRDETLVDIPLSIQAFDAEDLAEKGVTGLEELSSFAPNLFFVDATTGQGRYISEVRFRGLSTSSVSVVNQYGSIFEDGIYLMNGAQAIGFSDIERVEVVKGPQSAYFGRATFAGAVNFITREPSEEFRADLLATYSPSFNSYDLGASVEGALIPGLLSARLSAESKHDGAQYTASDGGDLGREQTDTANLTLLATPAPGLEIKLRGSYGEVHDSSPTSTYFAFDQYGNCAAGTPVTVNTTAGSADVTFAKNFHCGDIPADRSIIDRNTALITLPAVDGVADELSLYDVYVNNSLDDPLIADAPTLEEMGMVSKFWRISGSADYEIDDQFSVTVAGGYAHQALNQIMDTDGAPSPSNYSATPLFFTNYSAEGRLRYDNGDWLSASVGANYSRAKYRGSQDTGVAVINLFEYGSSVSRVARSATTNSNEELETVGLFFGIDVTPLDWLTLSFEGRYQIDDDTKFGGSIAAGTLVAENLHSENFTPRVIASFTPWDDTTIYASYSEGVMPGTANTNFIALSDADKQLVLAVQPDLPEVLPSEVLKNYEIGFKREFREAGAYISLAAFRMDWLNLKTSTTLTIPEFSNPIFGVQIPGSARIKGVEFEGNWDVTRNFSLQGTLGYVDAKLVEYTNTSYNGYFSGLATGATFSGEGNRLPRTPDLTTSASAIYEAPLFGDWDYKLRGDVFYTGRQYIDETNITSLADYATVNASVEVSDGDTSIRLWVDNLFDKAAWITGRRFIDLSGIPWNVPNYGQGSFVVPISKREVGVTLRRTF